MHICSSQSYFPMTENPKLTLEKYKIKTFLTVLPWFKLDCWYCCSPSFIFFWSFWEGLTVHVSLYTELVLCWSGIFFQINFISRFSSTKYWTWHLPFQLIKWVWSSTLSNFLSSSVAIESDYQVTMQKLQKWKINDLR